MEKHNVDVFEDSDENLKSVDLEDAPLLCGYGGTHTGVISSWYDFAVLLIVFPVCHWGNNGHKGRWIGLGGIVMAVGSLVCALPHWMAAPYIPSENVHNESDFGQCTIRDEKQCTPASMSSWLNPYFWMFILGQTLHGFGSTPLFSIGTTFIDENVSQKASPVYLAIHAVLTTLGPVVGLFVGGFLLNLHDDFDRPDRYEMNSSDPRWVGAWWVGFLISSLAALIIAFPILAFARELPEAKRHRAKDVNQCHAINADLHKKSSKDTKKLPEIIWVGGMLKMIAICHLIALIFITGLLMHCPKRNFVGVNMPYGNDLHPEDHQPPSIKSPCNSQCHCSSEWNPICDRKTGRIFYSACYAGCTDKTENSNGASWSSCSCISNTTSSLLSSSLLDAVKDDSDSEDVHSGYCSLDCGYNTYILMITIFITTVSSFAAGIPSQQIMLRVVPFDQRTLALGINWTFLRLLGFIPGGILFGVVIDTTCLQWGKSCGKSTSCLVYDPSKLSWTITALAIVCKLLSILATIIGYMTYRPSDLDKGASVASSDSHGALHLVVNDDRNDQPIQSIHM
ncbi:hypothetical protein WR25_17769 [Diploscapter pachys]|uniref:Kazal-like domain-containing protein n=1 Tax=Diploscapter pachys TaxID=2018661 RepID=A0A2A2LPI5_9BILA|nr:hypothetical protein WR25_17769 [Diploscapter pachys]